MLMYSTFRIYKSASSNMKRISEDKSSRTTRSKNKQIKDGNEEENREKENVLSQFKLPQKSKLKSEAKLKRGHVNVKHEEEINNQSCSNNQQIENIKIKEEVNENSEDMQQNKTSKKIKLNSDKKPENWEKILENLRVMRKNFDAPVDSMGCDKCMDEEAKPKDQRYQSLLSLMLSSRTKDEVTFAAMSRLKEHGCSVENMLQISDEKLGELIYPVAFWKNKVKFIKKTTQILRNEYNDDIPNTVEDLCKLPGVGPKMAYLCMKSAWGELIGIGVDTHVHRISNRLGWAKTKTPEETRKALEDWMPKEVWSEVNHLLVGFGQQICQGNKPQCSTCLNNNICPYGKKHFSPSNNKNK